MQASAYDPDLVNHASTFLYPFVHRLGGAKQRSRLDSLGERWQPWWTRLGDDQLAHSLEGTAFFLPYVQRLLFPELCHLQEHPTGPKFQNWTRIVRRLTQHGLQAFVDALPCEAVLRLTLDADALAQVSEFDIQQTISWGGRAMGQGKTPARFEWIDLLLFPSGLGFMLMKAKLTEPTPLFSQIIQMNKALQMVHPPSLSYRLPTFRLKASGAEMELRGLIDVLMQGVGVGTTIPEEEVLRFTSAPGYTDSEAGRAYGERCYALSYACLAFFEGEHQTLPKGTFATGEARMLFEFASHVGLGESVDNPMWVPAPEQTEKYAKKHTLATWRCWKAMALRESLVFLATENIPFTRRSLAQVIDTDYLPLYAFSLYQRFQLSVFTNDLMREVALVDEHLRGAQSLLQRFVAFRNQYMFAEITSKAQGSQLYCLLHHGLEIECLSNMVNASVREAKEFYQEQWDRQVALGVKVLGFVGGPMVATYGGVRYFLSTLGPTWIALLAVGALFLSSSALLLLLMFKPRRILRLPPPLPEEDEPPKLLEFPAETATPTSKAG